MKHQEIIESLPWYVNGTLSQTERAAVTQHLAGGCRECAQEIASLNAMRKLVVAVGDDAPEPSPYLLNRALGQIEDYERTRVQQKKAEPAQNWMSTLRESWWPKTPVFARMALAAQLALLLVLGAVAVYQHNHPEIVYKTASDPSNAQGKAMISVVFNEKASERDIRQALEEIQGTIIEGPTAQGSYTVQLPIHPEQTAEIDKALQTLRQKQQIVSSALEKQ